MRLHRFYVSERIGSKKEVIVTSAELANQISRVFRLRNGDKVILFDGSGFDYECQISESDRDHVTFSVLEKFPSRYMPVGKIYLCAAVVKKDNFEVIVEKATELGVTDIIPVLAERSEKKALNEGRLQKIVIEASEQSGRGDVPVIHQIKNLVEAIDFLKSNKINVVVFHTEDGDSKLLGALDNDEPVCVFIGPEGGWSLDEMSMFHKEGIRVVCLGSQVLRAETAVVAALSRVVFRV